MQRRRLLKIVGAFFLGQALDIAPALAATRPGARERATFAAFLDVLLPGDTLSGSATELRVDEQLWALSDTEARFRRLLELGCQWLNMTGGPPFTELSALQQNAVVGWMSTSDWDQIPRRFYELVRQTAVEVYYSDPAAWHGLPIDRPPQPLGYLPPWQ
ncbi:MAG: gluconate 2-dehydrogenase subunit 3 family protein [Rhodocyclales bacterium]|nr:gluconate 2-dehydrogenase subunit 3 family protein [Rhodocyclales bacterium]